MTTINKNRNEKLCAYRKEGSQRSEKTTEELKYSNECGEQKQR